MTLLFIISYFLVFYIDTSVIFAYPFPIFAESVIGSLLVFDVLNVFVSSSSDVITLKPAMCLLINSEFPIYPEPPPPAGAPPYQFEVDKAYPP